MDPETRIEQFRTLLESDPDNDMAHFSLGNALIGAGRHDEAAEAFIACTRVNPGMTKAFQLAGRALIDSGQTDRAKGVLLRGYEEATTRGDMLPKNEIEAMLGEIGEDIPEIKDTGDTGGGPAPPRDFKDRKTGRMGTKMPRAPFKGPIGAWYHEHVSKETFDEWIGMGTKIINELRLDLSRDEHDAVYDYAMRLYLGLDDDTYREITDGQEPPVPEGQFKTVIDEIITRGAQLEDQQGQMHARLDD